MSTGASPTTLGLFAEGKFWEGLKSFTLERSTMKANAAINANSWDELNKAKGAYEELAVLKRLKADADSFIAKASASKIVEK